MYCSGTRCARIQYGSPHAITAPARIATPTANPGLRNFDLTESGRRRKNSGKRKNTSSLNPPQQNPSAMSPSEKIPPRLQLLRRNPNWKNSSCASSRRNAEVVVGYPSSPFSSIRLVLTYIAAATTPACPRRSLEAAT